MNKYRMEKILQNAKNYRSNTLGVAGVITINHNQNVNQVIVSSELKEFTVEELQQILVVLMKMTVNEGNVTIVENDYIEIWSYVNYLVLNSKKRLDHWFHNNNPLASMLAINICREAKIKYNDEQNKLYQNAILGSNYLDNSSMIWSGYAFLEGICRRICSSYVTVEGRILHDFSLNGYNFKAGKNINSLKVMLNLTKTVVSDFARSQLDEVFSYYSPSQIYRWRNTTLHGAGDYSIPLIVIYTLISILSLELLSIINRDS